jgi:hypothetical protein
MEQESQGAICVSKQLVSLVKYCVYVRIVAESMRSAQMHCLGEVVICHIPIPAADHNRCISEPF